jgi:lipoprotein-anchoring transpeptidase ErfK/SrfK
MKTCFRFVFVAAVLAAFVGPLSTQAAKSSSTARSKEAMEAATRLQVFLDRAQFGPGKIDGRYGEFTLKALALYRQSRGEQSAAPTPTTKGKKDAAPDVTGLDLASVDPVFVSYNVTEDDLKAVGELAESVPAQAEQKSLPYKSAAEAIAEKFHTDIDFLAELNPGKTKSIKAGDTLTVPNVEPFDLIAVKDLRPGSEIAANEVDVAEGEKKSERKQDEKTDKAEVAASATPTVRIDTKTNMLSVYENDKLVAAYPVTIGSAQLASPIGDWKVQGVAKMPNFRYDKAMLNKGERSSDFHMLPPGPNNPVGIVWIQLNKKGIGLHGTNDPDSIGRSASHGCVRLANWDVVRLAGKVKAGVPVSIH